MVGRVRVREREKKNRGRRWEKRVDKKGKYGKKGG